jgi:hypothetical protein
MEKSAADFGSCIKYIAPGNFLWVVTVSEIVSKKFRISIFSNRSRRNNDFYFLMSGSHYFSCYNLDEIPPIVVTPREMGYFCQVN